MHERFAPQESAVDASAELDTLVMAESAAAAVTKSPVLGLSGHTPTLPTSLPTGAATTSSGLGAMLPAAGGRSALLDGPSVAPYTALAGAPESPG